MDQITELEKLSKLKQSGVITEQEFNEQKAALLNQSENVSSKSLTVYLLLAFLLGLYGVHQFYAGRIKRGILMLVLTLGTFGGIFALPGSYALISIGAFAVWYLIAYIWIFCSICVNKTDASGNEMQPSPVLRTVLIVLEVIFMTVGWGVLLIGGLAGYTMAMTRHRTNQLLDYSMRAAVTTMVEVDDEETMFQVSCEEILSGEPAPMNISCEVNKSADELPVVVLRKVPKRAGERMAELSSFMDDVCIRQSGSSVVLDFNGGC